MTCKRKQFSITEEHPTDLFYSSCSTILCTRISSTLCRNIPEVLYLNCSYADFAGLAGTRLSKTEARDKADIWGAACEKLEAWDEVSIGAEAATAGAGRTATCFEAWADLVCALAGFVPVALAVCWWRLVWRARWSDLEKHLYFIFV